MKSVVWSLKFNALCFLIALVVPQAQAASPWVFEFFTYDTEAPFVGKVEIRAGYYPENKAVPFRGNVLYLEGLGDSIANHDPLFEKLSENGFRVIGFDYIGQGGSSGSMNHTRVIDSLLPSLQISTLAKIVWEKFVRTDGLRKNRKIVLGWSTGALAAYQLAETQWAQAVILISPGILVKPIVGDKGKITLPTLTSATYFNGTKDPHVDPIRPTSPFEVPLFAGNLALAANASLNWKVSPAIPGIAFFGGDDSYIFPKASREVIEVNSPHFKTFFYPGARHEIDNEIPKVQDQLVREVLDFLKGL